MAEPPTFSLQFTETWEAPIPLPDTSQFTETWEEPVPLPDASRFIEGWEAPIPIDRVSASISPANPSLTGETVTVSGSVVDDTDESKSTGVEVTVEVVDDSQEVLQTKTGTTDLNGEYSVDIQLLSDASAFIRAVTAPGAAAFGSQPIAFGAGLTEGWEN